MEQGGPLAQDSQSGVGGNFCCDLGPIQASQVALVLRSLPASAGDIRDVLPSLSWEDPLERAVATRSRILAWGVPWTEEPGGPWSLGSRRAGHD